MMKKELMDYKAGKKKAGKKVAKKAAKKTMKKAGKDMMMKKKY